MFFHWTHNAHAKSFRDIATIVDKWDESEWWEAVSVQEVVGDHCKSGDSEVRLMTGVGRGLHTFAISPMRAGTHRFAIFTHNRWASVIQVAQYTEHGRSVAATLTFGKRRIRIIWGHLPSTKGHSADEFATHLAELTRLLRGRRRHWVSARVDTNTRITQSESGISGSALVSSSSSSSSSHIQAAERSNMGSFVSGCAGLNMKNLNTFAEWWAPHMMRHECMGSDRWMWRGPVFGSTSSRAIDYLLADTLYSFESHYISDSGHGLPVRPQDLGHRLRPRRQHRHPLPETAMQVDRLVADGREQVRRRSEAQTRASRHARAISHHTTAAARRSGGPDSAEATTPVGRERHRKCPSLEIELCASAADSERRDIINEFWKQRHIIDIEKVVS